MDYRERMRILRKQYNLSQEQLGRIIEKTQQGYSHIENGEAELKIKDLIKLCRFYNVTSDYFIGLSDNIPLDASNNFCKFCDDHDPLNENSI